MRPVQEEMPVEGPGVSAPKRIKAIEKAAATYEEARDARMKLTEKEVATRDKLLEAMHEHGVSIYRFGDQEVKIVPGKEKVRVKTLDGEPEAEDLENEED